MTMNPEAPPFHWPPLPIFYLPAPPTPPLLLQGIIRQVPNLHVYHYNHFIPLPPAFDYMPAYSPDQEVVVAEKPGINDEFKRLMLGERIAPSGANDPNEKRVVLLEKKGTCTTTTARRSSSCGGGSTRERFKKSTSFLSISRPPPPPCHRLIPRTFSCIDFDERNPHGGGRSTVMIKNIPNRISRSMLLDLLDKHCKEENHNKELLLPQKSSPGQLSEYDFVYLPMDFRHRCNLGYAFVNFTSPAAAWSLYRSMHHQSWQMFRSKKISYVCYAKLQGKMALMDNFQKSHFMCDSEEYLPVVFSPPRNGLPPYAVPTTLGRLWN